MRLGIVANKQHLKQRYNNVTIVVVVVVVFVVVATTTTTLALDVTSSKSSSSIRKSSLSSNRVLSKTMYYRGGGKRIATSITSVDHDDDEDIDQFIENLLQSVSSDEEEDKETDEEESEEIEEAKEDDTEKIKQYDDEQTINEDDEGEEKEDIEAEEIEEEETESDVEDTEEEDSEELEKEYHDEDMEEEDEEVVSGDDGEKEDDVESTTSDNGSDDDDNDDNDDSDDNNIQKRKNKKEIKGNDIDDATDDSSSTEESESEEEKEEDDDNEQATNTSSANVTDAKVSSSHNKTIQKEEKTILSEAPSTHLLEQQQIEKDAISRYRRPPNTLYRFLLRQGKIGRIIVMTMIVITEWIAIYIPPLHAILTYIFELIFPPLPIPSERTYREEGSLPSSIRTSSTAAAGSKKMKKALTKRADQIAIQQLKKIGSVQQAKYRYVSLNFMKRHKLGPYRDDKGSDELKKENVKDLPIVDTKISTAVGHGTKVKRLVKKRVKKVKKEETDWVVAALTKQRKTNKPTTKSNSIRPSVSISVGSGGPSLSVGLEFGGTSSTSSEMDPMQDVIDAITKDTNRRIKKRPVSSGPRLSDRDGGDGLMGRIRAVAGTDSILSRSLLGAYPGDAAPPNEAANPAGITDIAKKYGYGVWQDDDYYDDIDNDNDELYGITTRKKKVKVLRKRQKKQRRPIPSKGQKDDMKKSNNDNEVTLEDIMDEMQLGDETESSAVTHRRKMKKKKIKRKSYPKDTMTTTRKPVTDNDTVENDDDFSFDLEGLIDLDEEEEYDQPSLPGIHSDDGNEKIGGLISNEFDGPDVISSSIDSFGGIDGIDIDDSTSSIHDNLPVSDSDYGDIIKNDLYSEKESNYISSCRKPSSTKKRIRRKGSTYRNDQTSFSDFDSAEGMKRTKKRTVKRKVRTTRPASVEESRKKAMPKKKKKKKVKIQSTVSTENLLPTQSLKQRKEELSEGDIPFGQRAVTRKTTEIRPALSRLNEQKEHFTDPSDENISLQKAVDETSDENISLQTAVDEKSTEVQTESNLLNEQKEHLNDESKKMSPTETSKTRRPESVEFAEEKESIADAKEKEMRSPTKTVSLKSEEIRPALSRLNEQKERLLEKTISSRTTSVPKKPVEIRPALSNLTEHKERLTEKIIPSRATFVSHKSTEIRPALSLLNEQKEKRDATISSRPTTVTRNFTEIRPAMSQLNEQKDRLTEKSDKTVTKTFHRPVKPSLSSFMELKRKQQEEKEGND